jgi:hypothetical protein
MTLPEKRCPLTACSPFRDCPKLSEGLMGLGMNRKRVKVQEIRLPDEELGGFAGLRPVWAYAPEGVLECARGRFSTYEVLNQPFNMD